MPRRSKTEVAEGRANLLEHKADVIKAYRDGATRQGICRTWGVDDNWLTAQFDEWGVRVRGRSEADVSRGPGVPPRSPKRIERLPS
ncbi:MULTISPECIES: hypothetical protein [unclassified Streptomyces]|uniref:hypothetical protein n=1 Tax=unclassified Streptomyces TaxID=2593676 RepID=UPI00344B4254